MAHSMLLSKSLLLSEPVFSSVKKAIGSNGPYDPLPLLNSFLLIYYYLQETFVEHIMKED